jgi:hypothetical protein
MTLDEILTLWNEDADIDQTKLDTESLSIPKIHGKYWKILNHERMLLRKYESDFKKLSLQKYEFFTQGPTKETNEKGWELPACGKVIKSDCDRYLEADSDLIDLSLKIGLQKEKVFILEDIIRSINNRNWIIRNAIEFLRWQAGG